MVLAGEATIEVDSFPNRSFTGTVSAVSPGTGAQFSILPPQNASGNWVKVAQRVPVKVTVDDPDPALPLRVGATATVEVALRAPSATAAVSQR